MKISNSRPLPRRLVISLAAGAAVLATLIGVGVYGIAFTPRPAAAPPAPSAATSAPTAAAASPSPLPSEIELSPIPWSTNAKTFARSVAAAVFDWDTASGFEPTDYEQVVVNAGDPTGDETPGLASDLDAYLPDATAWAQLTQFGTRQWIDIHTVTVPTEWAVALAQAKPGQILPGTIAYTITGTRHRTGTFDGKKQDSTQQVSFTEFITCKPSFPQCHVLRLSELNNPLR